MMKIKTIGIVNFFLLVVVVSLSFTGLFAFTIGGFPISYYIVFGLCFIMIIALLKFEIPPIGKSFSIVILVYIIISSLINFNNVKLTSIIYSSLFIFFYIYLSHYSNQNLTKELFVKALKIVLLSFFIVLVISQIIVLLDWYELETLPGYFQSKGPLGIEYNNKTGVFRYYSLSTEPSYASIIVLVSYACLKELGVSKRVYIIFGLITLYMIFSFKSTIGFLGIVFWIISKIKITKRTFLILLIAFVTSMTFFFFTDIGGKTVDRLRDFVSLFFSNPLNFIKELNLIDSSAYARIGPFFNYVSDSNWFSIHFYFGNGASSSVPYFSKMIYPEVWNIDMVFKPPFFPGFLFDYGIIGVSIVLYFIWQLVKSKSIFFKFIVLVILFNSNFNTQLFWFIITLITLSNIYIDKQANEI